jgi:AcrR family transcriptional regulator
VTVDLPTPRRGTRRASRTAAGHVPLDRERILAAALLLMDGHGLEALSMRKLAGELDVEAMSLYHHVPGKPALLEGLAEMVLAEVRLPRGDPEDPTGAVRGVARALRENALAHPSAIPLLGALGLGSPAARRHTEDVLGILGDAGFAPRDAFTTFLLVRSYVLGYVLWEVRHTEARAAGTIPPTEAGTLTSADVPHLAPLAVFITTFDNDAEFERGLDVLVAGLEPAPHPERSTLP